MHFTPSASSCKPSYTKLDPFSSEECDADHEDRHSLSDVEPRCQLLRMWSSHL